MNGGDVQHTPVRAIALCCKGKRKIHWSQWIGGLYAERSEAEECRKTADESFPDCGPHKLVVLLPKKGAKLWFDEE